ncbi:MAG TPA: hypothetical protein VM243_17555 [Phycisphaerae bacterium]|nr:hypothetical protein [Phycisphaerae bacterium]
MKIRELLTIGMVVLACTLLAGCQSAASGGGGSSAPDDTNTAADNDSGDGGTGTEGEGDGDTGTDDKAVEPEPDATEVDNTPVETDPDDDQTALTDEEADAVNAAVLTVGNLAGLFAALGAGGLPATDGAAVVLNPLTGCPTITPTVTEGAMSFTIDYGDGCSPVLDPGSTYSGSISGEVNVATRTITLTLDDFVMDGVTVDGSVEASVSQEGNLLILESTVDVVFTEGEESAACTGDVTVELNPITGELFIPTADLSSVDQTGDEYAIVLTDVHIDLIEVLPDAGTATVVLGTIGPGALTVEITFTEGTPTDGTVLVSVNGSPPITLSLEDIEDIEDIQ